MPYDKKKGNAGKIGPVGEQASIEPRTNVSGENGHIDIQNPSDIDPGYFGQQLTPVLGRMLLRQSVLDHVNGRYEEAAHRLAWLYKLLKPRIERTDNSAPLIGDDTSNIDVVPDEFGHTHTNTKIEDIQDRPLPPNLRDGKR